MAIYLRNDRVEKLARDTAAEAGESITQAVAAALEDRLRRLRQKRVEADLVEQIMAISRRTSTLKRRHITW